MGVINNMDILYGFSPLEHLSEMLNYLDENNF